MIRDLMTAVFACALLVFACAACAGASWAPVKGQLMTRWAAEVSPDKVLPEYPRPQMKRADWKNLNGLWQFEVADSLDNPPLARDLEGSILVPFPVESVLSGVAKQVERVWYRRRFTIPASWRGQRVLLHFGASNWETRVFINGKPLPVHRGGYDAFSFDITGYLPAGARPHEIVVGVYNTMDAPGPNPRGKQILEPKDIWFSQVTGIWQTVWLEPVPAAHIASYRAVPDLERGGVGVTVRAGEPGRDRRVEVQVMDESRVVARATGRPGEEVFVPLPDARLWSPESPYLYRLAITLEGGKDADRVDGYFGMRSVGLGPDEKGVTRMLLNGKPYFQAGALDQGYWPDGLYTAPTDEALKYDLELSRRYGFNMVRKHVKVEPARWYYWADKMGMLVWQDMPNAFNNTREYRSQWEAELKRMVEGLWNHPSIIMWVVFNESWGQWDETPRITNEVKAMDPSRLVNNASGWNDSGAGDIVDAHHYPDPRSPKPEPKRAAVCGEFGGVWVAPVGHLWKRPGHVYRSTQCFAQGTERYVELVRQAHDLRSDPGMSAFVYCEITDQETEIAGLVSFDRAVFKLDPDRVARANRGEFPSRPAPFVLAPTAEGAPVEWRYTFESPGGSWFGAGYDDGAWERGPAGFGNAEARGGTVRTEWTGTDLWARRAFDLESVPEGEVVLNLHHDEAVEVYINGVLALREHGFTGGYVDHAISPEARRTLKKGRNVLAIHVGQTEGGQFLDAGLSVYPKAAGSAG